MKNISILLIIVLAGNYIYAEKYRLGDKGEKIKKIQTALVRLGYLPDIDGKYGIKTRFAVIAFQKVNRIQIDGIIGPQTLASLENPLIPKARFKGNERCIEVDTKLQVLYIVENGGIKYIIPISTGKNNSTVKGKFRIYSTKKGWHKVVGRPWSGYIHNPIYFHGAYAIHGYKNVPNYPASHGCIRVPLCYSDFIFEYIRKNNVRYIYIY